MTITGFPPPGRFVHPAVFYASEEEYLSLLVPFVVAGLEQGHPVAASVPARRLRLLREGLGAAAEDVLLLDMEVEGRNPGRIIPGVLRRFADRHPGEHVRIIGEPIWAGRTDAEYPACAQHEALINLAFADRDITIACPYDTASLDEHVVADALATHPLVWETDRRYGSDHYAPDAVVDRYNQPFDVVPDAVTLEVTTSAGIRDARRFATGQAGRLGLSDDRTADLALITTELVVNSLRHAGGTCLLSIWRDDTHLVCTVRDDGHLADPLAGRRPAAVDQDGGRGLLVVNQLADLVRVHTTPKGTTTHVFLRMGD
ncbi:anti-sigma regulatory factor (Ser/Thr protein kinase) [Saccharothrix saharensis]|uniref:Anti-sigma regulatory factor (Ser/Thr protein kinase) n=1 Tax=Saccharothrix saharensis TaxID=571190 RepID=A0A543JNN7_9PSEU|nr:sensor histidine kinase [Saccharothrix saharensis]TQM84443.1 anti-sigma regulatory factor (Ser/Thr protein kinase) [Saccharothrix saharensis]